MCYSALTSCSAPPGVPAATPCSGMHKLYWQQHSRKSDATYLGWGEVVQDVCRGGVRATRMESAKLGVVVQAASGLRRLEVARVIRLL